MTTLVFDPTEPVAPTEADATLARESARRLAPQLAKANGTMQLHVVEPNPFPSGMDGGILTMPDNVVARHAKAHLPRVAKQLVPKSVRVTSLVSHGRAASVIVETAEEKGVDLIVLSTHGHTGLDRLLMGSTAEQVVRHAQCPVWVVRKPLGA